MRGLLRRHQQTHHTISMSACLAVATTNRCLIATKKQYLVVLKASAPTGGNVAKQQRNKKNAQTDTPTRRMVELYQVQQYMVSPIPPKNSQNATQSRHFVDNFKNLAISSQKYTNTHTSTAECF